MAHDTLIEEYGNKTWVDLNRPEMVRHLLAQVPDPRFLIGAYDGSRLVGFIANLPRRYRCQGKVYRAVTSTMLAVRRDYRGAAPYLIAESLHRNEAYGADFALLLLERGNRSSRMFNQLLKPRYPIKRLTSMYALVRGVDLHSIVEHEDLGRHQVGAIKLLGAHRPIVSPAVGGNVRGYAEADLTRILELMRGYRDQARLVRVFDRQSLARQLDTEKVTSTVIYERGSVVRGFINFTIHEVVSANGRYRWAWPDFAYWEGLSDGEKRALLSGLWQASRDRGCSGIMAWSKTLGATGALYRSRFIPYPRCVDVHAWILNPSVSLPEIDGIVERVI